MRPPMQKWQKTGDAFEALFAALVGSANPIEHARLVQNARQAITDLREHIDSAEECEEP